MSSSDFKISELQITSSVEWKVPLRNSVESPIFSIQGSKWCLCKEIQSIGRLANNASFSVRLRRVEDSLPSRNTKFILRVKEVGNQQMAEPKRVFDNDHEVSQWFQIPLFMLLTFTPTVICTLTLCDLSNDAASEDRPSASIGNTNLVQLSEDFKEMFLSGKACDATVKVRGTAFSVHRGVLETRSPVFAALFEADMKERHTGTVEIVDCDPEAFRDFLLYLYSGTTEKLSKNAFELYRMCDKYNVQELKSQCLAFLVDNLNCENVLEAFVLAHLFAEEELKNRAQVFFGKNFEFIASTDHWESFLNEKTSLAKDLLISMSKKMEYKD